MPSLYESTVNTGEVSSSNFTTLYNASGLAVPNAGAGQITGNLNVGGNLTVQGNSLLVGEVTLQSTLSLPNYTFPLPDGSTDQVLVTDGNGNLYWSSVQALPGADYNISATPATGGANLTLANTAGFTDSVRFASGTNIVVSRTDANTITISTPVTDTTYTIDASATTGGANLNLVGSNSTTDTIKFAGGTNITVSQTDANTITIATNADDIPNGTARGQVLYWNGSAWTASSNIASSALNNRLVATFESSNPGYNSALFVRKDYGATAYSATNNDGVAINFSLDSDSQGISAYAAVVAEYSPTDPQFFITTSTDNFVSANFNLLQIQKSTANLYAPNITLNATQTGSPTLNATITAERGSLTDATLTWNEANDRWEFTNDLQIAGDLTVLGNDIKSSTGLTAITLDNNSVVVAGDITVSGQDIKSNGGTTAITLNGADVTVVGDLAVNGGDITTTSGTGNLFNTNATTVNLGNGADVEVNIGSPTGGSRVQIKPATIVGANTTQAVFNTVATTVNAFGAATALNMGATSGTMTLRNPTIVGSQTTQNLFNTTATTVNAFGAATAVNIGAATGTTTVAHDLTVNGGNINLNGAATAGVQPFITFANQPDGVNSMYGIRGKSTVDDPWFLGAGSTGDDQGYLEIATGDNAGDPFGTASPIYVRQYNGFGGNQVPWYGGTATVVNELALLDGNGDTSIPNNLTVGGTISTEGVTFDLTTPVQQGQLLYVSDAVTPTITNSSVINFNSVIYRPNFQADTGIYGRTQSGLAVSSNTGATPFTTGDGSSVIMAVVSDSQTLTALGSLATSYNTTGDHEVRLTSSTNNFASDQATSITGGNTLVFPIAHNFSIGDKLSYAGPTQNGLTYDTTYYVIGTGFTTTQCQISLTSGGSAVALTNGTGLSLWFFNGVKRLLSATSASVDLLAPTILLNATNTGVPFTGTAGIEVERGTTGANQTFAWNETFDFWNASSSLYADDYVIGGIGLATNGNNIIYNNEDTNPPGDCNLIVKSGVSAGVDANFRWNDTTNRWQDTIDGTNYFNLPNQNLDTTSDVNFSQVSLDNITTINTQTTTTIVTTPTVISSTTRASQKAVIRIVDNLTGDIQMLEALAFSKGTTAYLTTYAEMYTGVAALATFTADVSGGSIRIIATPASTNNTTFTVVRTSLD